MNRTTQLTLYTACILYAAFRVMALSPDLALFIPLALATGYASGVTFLRPHPQRFIPALITLPVTLIGLSLLGQPPEIVLLAALTLYTALVTFLLDGHSQGGRRKLASLGSRPNLSRNRAVPVRQ